MSGYVRAVNFVKNLVKGGSKTSPTISSTKINVGNLKKNQETFNKLKKITDTYVTKAGKVDPGLKKALRDSGSKSLQKTDKILRKNKKDGGRMGLKRGGGKFPDHSGDGKITQKDILMAKGVIPKKKKKTGKKK